MYHNRKTTSTQQFEIMVSFMEKYGDLCKPVRSPFGKRRAERLWQQLTFKLNNAQIGFTKSEIKWRKVWCDLKNNVRKKLLRTSDSGLTESGKFREAYLSGLDKRVAAVAQNFQSTVVENNLIECIDSNGIVKIEDPIEVFNGDLETVAPTSSDGLMNTDCPAQDPLKKSAPMIIVRKRILTPAEFRNLKRSKEEQNVTLLETQKEMRELKKEIVLLKEKIERAENIEQQKLTKEKIIEQWEIEREKRIEEREIERERRMEEREIQREKRMEEREIQREIRMEERQIRREKLLEEREIQREKRIEERQIQTEQRMEELEIEKEKRMEEREKERDIRKKEYEWEKERRIEDREKEIERRMEDRERERQRRMEESKKEKERRIELKIKEREKNYT